MTRTRFAPSPTGFLHIGGLRTALFAYLWARKNNGVFILRIEDTDRERLVEGGIENIISSLKWAGLSIDEGVDMDEEHRIIQKGSYGPYIQSERLAIYQKYAQILLEKGAAYYAFDTTEELDEMRKQQEAAKQPSMYDRESMKNQFTIGADETKKRIEGGETYVLRLNVPRDGETAFVDRVRGEVRFQNKLIDDQVLMKGDGFPTYHLANVVDDHEMQITDVIRGEEWLSSTPKHVLLYKAFGWEMPTFAHLSLLVNEQKQKLSKRHGDVSVEDFKEAGYLPEALVNFIAFLGWNPGDEREIFSLEELVQSFDWDKVSKAAAVFNREKLDWYGKQYIAAMPLEELTHRAEPFFEKSSLLVTSYSLPHVVALEQGRAATLKELAENSAYLFADTLKYDPELLVWKKSTVEDAKEKLSLLHDHVAQAFRPDGAEDWSREFLENNIMAWITQNNFDTGNVLWPMRVALSGLKNSPGPFDIAGVLGKEKTQKRLEDAIKLL